MRGVRGSGPRGWRGRLPAHWSLTLPLPRPGVVYDESAVVADIVLSGKAVSPNKLLTSIVAASEEIQK